MRCSEAERRLSVRSQTDSGFAGDHELLEHLRTCPQCALAAQAEQELRRSLAAASVSDNTDDLSWSQFVARVEAQSDRQLHNKKGTSVMSKIVNPLRRRPRLSISLAAATLVLVVCIIVPFKYDSSVGYEVAVAGVDKDIALNPDRIDTLLVALGVEGAHIDVSDCDVKCLVHISEIETAEDAQLVAMAFETLEETAHSERIVIDPRVNMAMKTVITINGQPQEVYEHNLQMEMTERLGLHYHRIIRVILRGDTLWFDGIDKEAALSLAGQDTNLSPKEQKELQEKITLKYIEEHKCTEADADSASKHAEDTDLPEGLVLSQNYPNPFNPTTQFSYSLPEAQQVTIEIFNIRGQKVRTLVDTYVSAGEHTVEWNSLSDAGNQVASGIYFYRLQAGDVVTTKKMTLLK